MLFFNISSMFPLSCVWSQCRLACQPAAQVRGHTAPLNLQTKGSRFIMATMDLTATAWSMPAHVSADAQLPGTMPIPRQHKRSPPTCPAHSASCTYSPPKLRCFTIIQEKVRLLEKAAHILRLCVPSCGQCLEVQLPCATYLRLVLST